MLAVFGKDSPRDRKRARGPAPRPAESASQSGEEDDALYEAMAPLVSSLPKRQRGYVNEYPLGHAGSCLGYLETLDQSLAESGRAVCFMRGDLDCDDVRDDESVAKYVLDLYLDKWPDVDDAEDMQSWIKTNVGTLQGDFAMIIFDMETRRAIVARGAADEHGLFWARTTDGTRLIVGSDASFLEDCPPPASLPRSSVLVCDADAAKDIVFSLQAGTETAGGESLKEVPVCPKRTAAEEAPGAEKLIT